MKHSFGREIRLWEPRSVHLAAASSAVAAVTDPYDGRMRWVVWLILLAVPAKGEEVLVFAAASLSDVMKEIAAGYKPDRIVFNFAASSVLARQIEEGAPADLFLSADEAKMDSLKGLIDPKTRVSVLSNRLVVVVPAGGRRPPLQEILKGSMAMAEPNSVPAGIYARQWLQSIGTWNPRKVIPTENVRGALAAVEAGNVDAAIVYKTDALISRRVQIAYEVVKGPRISYPFAVVAETKHPRAARRFLTYLRSPAALATFAKYGFVILR